MAYVYQGLTKEHADKIIAQTMKYLEDDDEPDAIMGGFPPPTGGNPSKYYPSDKDRPKQLKEKAARREKYREFRLLEAKKGIAEMDAKCVIGGLVFPKGVAIEVPAGHALLQKRVIRDGRDSWEKPCKMDALVTSGSFKKTKEKGVEPKTVAASEKVVSEEEALLKSIKEDMPEDFDMNELGVTKAPKS